MSSLRLRPLLPYMVVVFLGYVSFSIQLPFYPDIFLDPEKSILPQTMTIEMKTILLGIVLAAYPLGQFFGAPIIGIFSDRWGRRKVVIGALSIKFLGYLITAYGVDIHSMLAILGGLMLCGLAEANITIAQAVIGDFIPKENRVRYFAIVNFFASVPFIVGPLLGIILVHNIPGLAFSIPFWIGAALSLISVGVIWQFSTETKKGNFFTLPIVEGIKENWNNLTLRKFYLTVLLLYYSLYSFWDCIGIYLERYFGFTVVGVAYVKAYDALFYCLGLLVLVPIFAKKLTPKISVGLASLGFSVMLTVLVFPKSPQMFYLTIPPLGLLTSILLTNAAAVVSIKADQQIQGHALGTLQSMQVTAGMSVGILGGLLAALRPVLPLWAGALTALIGGFLLLRNGKSP